MRDNEIFERRVMEYRKLLDCAEGIKKKIINCLNLCKTFWRELVHVHRIPLIPI